MLLFRVGWLGWLRQQSAATAAELAEHLVAPGLLSGRRWRRTSGTCTSRRSPRSVAVEAWPPVTTPDRGFLHLNLITYFGMNLGEMRDIDALAADRAADGVYEFLLTSAPLNIRGGVGSPPNALGDQVGGWSLVVGGEGAAARQGAALRARTR